MTADVPDQPLPTPTTEAGRRGLSALLAHPESAVLAVDFDGTLAPIVEDPAQARAHPGATGAMARLAAHLGTVAVITGRPVRTVMEYGGFAGDAGLSELVVLGHYGLERWDPDTGTVVTPDVPGDVAGARAALPGALRAADDRVEVEDKGHSLAVHTRRAADPQGELDRLREPLRRLAEQHGLTVEPGRLVLELRPPGIDKGRALTSVVREREAGVAVFAGDDLGDLAAFAAIDALRNEGVDGVKVCSGSVEVVALAEQADLVVDGPAGVVALMEALAAALERR